LSDLVLAFGNFVSFSLAKNSSINSEQFKSFSFSQVSAVSPYPFHRTKNCRRPLIVR
jgi:hypothetical protein